MSNLSAQDQQVQQMRETHIRLTVEMNGGFHHYYVLRSVNTKLLPLQLFLNTSFSVIKLEDKLSDSHNRNLAELSGKKAIVFANTFFFPQIVNSSLIFQNSFADPK